MKAPVASTLIIVATLAACTEDPQPMPSPTVELPVLVTRTEPDGPHVQPIAPGNVTLSPTNCFALGDPTTIIYAPAGSTVSPDGGGFIVEGTEYRIGDPVTTLSGQVFPLDKVVDPSARLLECEPEKVAMLWWP